MLQVQELLFDTDADRYVAVETHELPASVTVLNFADYFRVTYGEPLDVARTVTPAGDDLIVGWTYPLAEDIAAEFGIGNGELIAIPLARDEDGEVLPLFELLRRQGAIIEMLEDDPRVNVILLPADEPWVPDPDDDADESDEADGGPVDEVAELVSAQRPREALRLAEDELDTPDLDDDERAWLLARRGDALSDLGQLDDALASYADARAIFERLEDGYGVVSIDMELGITLGRMGRPVESRRRFESALAGYEAAEDDEGAARCRLNMASCFRQLGDLEAEEETLERAREAFEELGLRREYLDATFNLANSMWFSGDLVAARDIYAALRPQYEELGLPVQAADCDDTLGALIHEFGDVDGAIELHREAHRAYVDHDQPREAAVALMNLGHALDHAERFDEAIEALTAAEEAFAAMGDGTLSTAHYLRAWVEVHRGNVDAAMDRLAVARALDRESGSATGTPYYNLCAGAILNASSRWVESATVLEHAIEGLRALGDRKTVAEARLELATALRGADRLEEAGREVVAAREAFEAMGFTNRLAECDAQLATTSDDRTQG